jgi:restriction endonuclease
MKLKFKKQEYQTEAVDAVVKCFTGQPPSSLFKYKIDPGRDARPLLQDAEISGFANDSLKLTFPDILKNMQEVQRSQNLPISNELVGDKKTGCAINLDVEMETGTGKTYCYIKTMFELNKQYGWSKFIVVVPSIAIREGKLPKGFAIPTPVGDYNPDWAISFKEGMVKHIYFVAETKGSLSSMELRKIEKSKIECARKFFSKITSNQVKYDVVDSYGKLMEIVK